MGCPSPAACAGAHPPPVTQQKQQRMDGTKKRHAAGLSCAWSSCKRRRWQHWKPGLGEVGLKQGGEVWQGAGQYVDAERDSNQWLGRRPAVIGVSSDGRERLQHTHSDREQRRACAAPVALGEGDARTG